MKKFLSLLLALTLALSIALPAATASADDAVNDDLAQAWATSRIWPGEEGDFPTGYPNLKSGEFFIAKFTHDQLKDSNVADSFVTNLTISVSGSTGEIAAYVGQCGLNSNNPYSPDGFWTPILISGGEPVATFKGSGTYQLAEYYNLPAIAGGESDDYLAIGFSLQSEIKSSVTVTISLYDSTTLVASASHTFEPSSDPSGGSGSQITGFNIHGQTVNNNQYYSHAILTHEENELTNVGPFYLYADVLSEDITWTSTNENIIVTAKKDFTPPVRTIEYVDSDGKTKTITQPVTVDETADAYITVTGFGEADITASIGGVPSNNTYHVWVRPPLHTVVGLTYVKGTADANGAVPVYVKSGDNVLATVKVTAQLTDGDGYIKSNDTASVDNFDILELVKNLVEDKHSIGYDESTLKLVEIGAEKVTESSDTVILTNIGPYLYLNYKDNEYNYGYTVAAEYLTSGAYSNRNIRVKAPDGAQAVDIKQEWTAGSETSKNVAVSEGYAAIDNVKPYASLRVTTHTGDEPSQTDASWKENCWIYGQNLDLLSRIIHQTYLFVPSSLYNDGLYVTVSFNNSVKTYYLKNLQKITDNGGAFYIIPQEAFAYQMGYAITIDLYNYDGTAKTLYIQKTGDDGKPHLWTLDGGEYTTSIYHYLDTLAAEYAGKTDDSWYTTWHDFTVKTKAYGLAAEAGYKIGNVHP